MAFSHLCFLSLISVAGIHTFLSLLAILLQKWTITLNCMMPFSLSFVFPQTPTSHGLLSYFSLVFFFFSINLCLLLFSLFFLFPNTTGKYIYIYIIFFLFSSCPGLTQIQICCIIKFSPFSIQPDATLGKKL
jgi:hypothetical protein